MFPFFPRQSQHYNSGGFNPYAQQYGYPDPRLYSTFDPYEAYHAAPSRPHTSSFDFPSAFYDQDEDGVMDSTTYRRIAAEHQRKAEVALALAQEQEQRNRELQRRLALDRLRQELAGHAHRQQQQEIPVRGRRESLRPISGEESDRRSQASLPAYPSTFSELPRTRGGTLEDEIRHFLQRREQEQELVRPRGGLRAATPARREASVSRPQATSSVPVPVVVTETGTPARRDDLASQIRQALSSGRSEQEKDGILRELGLTPSQAAQPKISTDKTTSSQTPATPHVPSQSTSNLTTVPVTAVPSQEAPAPTQSSTPTSAQFSSSSFATLDAVQTQFTALKNDFVFPALVEFAAPSTDGPQPKLLYTKANAPVLHYESELIKLLTKLDAIESGGAESVRGARKALVQAIEAELDALENLKTQAWTKQQQPNESTEPQSEAAEKNEEQGKPSDAANEPAVEASPAPLADQSPEAPAADSLDTASDPIAVEEMQEQPVDKEEPAYPSGTPNTQLDVAKPESESEPAQPSQTEDAPSTPGAAPVQSNAEEHQDPFVVEENEESDVKIGNAGQSLELSGPPSAQGSNWVRIEVQ